MLTGKRTSSSAREQDEEELLPQSKRVREDLFENREQLHKANIKLLKEQAFSVGTLRAPRLQASGETGVHEFEVNANACAELLHFVTDKKNRDVLGVLKLKEL